MTDSPAKHALGFAGVGKMAAALLERLARAERPVRVAAGQLTDLLAADLPQDMLHVGDSLPDLGERCGVIMLCFLDAAAVNEAVGQMLPSLKPGALVVDCSAAGPAAAKFLHDVLTRAEARYVDAATEGDADDARAGLLKLYVGGAPEDMADAEPVLQLLTREPVRCGPVGSGRAVKWLRQGFSLMHLAAERDALRAAAAYGLHPGEAAAWLKGAEAQARGLSAEEAVRSAKKAAEAFPSLLESAAFREAAAYAAAAPAATDSSAPQETS